jgi:hypothetical protein
MHSELLGSLKSAGKITLMSSKQNGQMTGYDLWIAARYAGRTFPQSISRTNVIQENGGEMQNVLSRCNMCGYGTFEFKRGWAELRTEDGAMYEICHLCVRTLYRRHGKYELAGEIANPTRKVKHVKR